MPHTLKEGDKVNAFTGYGKYAEIKKGTIIFHDEEGGYWSGTPFLVEFDEGGEGWFDYTSLSQRGVTSDEENLTIGRVMIFSKNKDGTTNVFDSKGGSKRK